MLLRRSLLAFTALYPSHLTKWEGRLQRRQFAPFDKAYGRALPFLTIELAERTGMQVLLPSAMLHCCSYSISDILTGVRSPSGENFTLNRDMQIKILRSRTRLSSRAYHNRCEVANQAQALNPPNGDRLSSQYALAQVELHSWVTSASSDDWADPFDPTWPSSALLVIYGRRYKSELREQVKKPFRKLRERVWKELHTLLELPPWENLRRGSFDTRSTYVSSQADDW